MLNMIYKLTSILTQYEKLLLPVGILISLALCFMGFKYLNAWVASFGFFAGLGAGYLVSSQMIAESTYAPILIGVLTGVVLMLLSFLIFKAGIFALTAVLVGEMIFGLPIMERVKAVYLPGDLGAKIVAATPLLIAVVVGIAAGIAAVKVTRTVIILVTGGTGAYRAVMYLVAFMNVYIDRSTRFIWIGVIILLALFGITVQFFTTKK